MLKIIVLVPATSEVILRPPEAVCREIKILFACNLFACLSGMASHALYGMTPCFGLTGVTFDAENDRPGPGSIRGHFEATRGFFETEGFVLRL